MLHLWVLYLGRWISESGLYLFPLVEDVTSERDRFRVVEADFNLHAGDNKDLTHLSVKTSNLLQSDGSRSCGPFCNLRDEVAWAFSCELAWHLAAVLKEI